MKTPGVYIVEQNAFPNSVVEVPTAVPAFIGYTEKAANGNKSLRRIPFRITSMHEYTTYFGGASQPVFELKAVQDSDTLIQIPTEDPVRPAQYELQRSDRYNLCYQLSLFFANGGGTCYIVSAGTYQEGNFSREQLESSIGTLEREPEPTMLVIPEAVYLSASECYGLQQAMLEHCGRMRNRIAILDVHDGYRGKKDSQGDIILNFREGIGTNHLSYAAAYYPWLNTSIMSEREISLRMIANPDLLKKILLSEAKSEKDSRKSEQLAEQAVRLDQQDMSGQQQEDLHRSLLAVSHAYKLMIQDIRRQLNLLPPSAAMAGIYTRVDNMREVWKAPANVSLGNVVSPAVNISHRDQEELNVPLNGKSINAIRSFVGEGVLVWGARTLDGNSQDWRYINVRRTLIMLEESIKASAKAFVFEPNVASTWVAVRSMIVNFLTSVWKRGGLAGASPDDAFEVRIGLGETMTPNDIPEGIMRITIRVAVLRPAEFIEITFMQQMQQS